MASTAELLISIQANTGSAVSAISELEQQTRLLEQIMANTSSTTETAATKTAAAQSVWSKFGSELQNVGRIAVGMASGILIGDITMGIAERVKTAAEAIDVFGTAVFKVQTVTGATAEQSSQLVAIFERYGFTGDETASKLSRLERALANQDTALDLTASGGKRGAQVLAEIGVATSDASGKVLPMTEVLRNLIGVWGTLDATSRNNAARVLGGGLGGGGSEQLNVLLSQGVANYDLLAEAVNRYGFSLTQENVNDVRSFTLAHKDLDMALQGVSIQFGAAFMPAITSAAQSTAAFAQALNTSVIPVIHAFAAAPLTSWLIPATAGTLLLGGAFQLLTFLTAPLIGLFGGVTAAVVGEGTASVVAAGEVTALALAEDAAGASGATAATGGLAALGASLAALPGLFFAATAAALAFPIAAIKLGIDNPDLVNYVATHPEGSSAGADQGAPLPTRINDLSPPVVPPAAGAPTPPTDNVPASVKAAIAELDTLKAQQQALQNAAAERKAQFDISSLGDAQKLLELKSQEIEANSALVDYKRQLEDIDRNAVNFAQQRLQLEEQRRSLLAQQTASPLQNANADIKFQEDEIKAQIRASRAGGGAVNTDALRQELHDLQRQDIRLQPGLLVAEHNVVLANRAKAATDLDASLAANTTAGQKLDITQAMAPADAAAVVAKRALEDQQHIVDLEKQRFDLTEKGFAAEVALAEARQKGAASALFMVQHPEIFPTYGPAPTRVAQNGPGPTSETAYPAPIINVNVGQVGHDPGSMWDELKGQFIAAWNAAMQGTPVAGALGGNFASGSAPR